MDGTDSASSPKADSSLKRKSNDNDQPRLRAKRNRYISIACNECKRRKIKCNGQSPCQRCGNLSLECQYAPNCCNNFKDSEEFKEMVSQISSLQQQVDTLYSNLSTLRNQMDTNVVAIDDSPFLQQRHSRSLSASTPVTLSQSMSSHNALKHPRFHGPTSAVFNLGVAKSSLQNMGITAPEEALDENLLNNDQTPTGSPPPMHTVMAQSSFGSVRDPIWSVSKEEAVRLVQVWQDEMGCMYPVVNLDRMMDHINNLYSFLDATRRSGLVVPDSSAADSISDDETILLKLVIATAAFLEGSGTSALGQSIYSSISATVESLLVRPPDIKVLQMLIVAAMFHFHRDDEVLAWRLIGLAARICLELGLHRFETYNTVLTTHRERYQASIIFWSIYVLDRRWGFGVGMPFVLQESDIDPMLLKPDDTTPYLTAMINLSGISSKVWQRVANADIGNEKVNVEEMEYLDFQVIQWHRQIPEHLKYVPPVSNQPEKPTSRPKLRLRFLLYLRANQMRILIGRTILHTTTSIMENLNYAHTVVDVAKDSIQVLTAMNQTTDLYRTQQVMFNYFLISALAVLFLAVSHAPNQFNASCRDEFYMALDLVRTMSANSYVGKRLWKTIKVLKEVGPKLGLNVRNNAIDASDPHSSAAVAMAGLAGHPIDEMAIFGTNNNNSASSLQLGEGWDGMANDLTNLFEAVGVMPNNGYIATSSESLSNGDALGSVLAHPDGLSRIFKDLF